MCKARSRRVFKVMESDGYLAFGFWDKKQDTYHYQGVPHTSVQFMKTHSIEST